MNWLIVSDLDGTLLDDGYPNATAAAAIDTIAETYADAWVALASSKTPSEMIELAGRCRSDPILIFENGSGMAWREPVLCRPGACQLDGFEIECFGTPHPEVLQTLRMLRLEHDYPFRGFSDMTPAEVASLTGLSQSAAEKAQRRVGSEPLQWLGNDAELEVFREDLAGCGFELTRGGRFFHVGSHVNKGRALKKLWRVLRFQFGVHATTLACGDAPNDIEMLERADHALVFPAREGGYLEPENSNVSKAPNSGPSGWLRAVSSVIDSHREVLAS